MMRRAAIVLALLLAAVARAEDDDAVLEAPPLGEPIPERMQALEKEWDDDVGTKDHADPAAEAEPDPFERNAAPEDDPDVEVKTPPPADEQPEPPRRASTLEQPLARDQPPAKPATKPSGKASAKPDGGAERRAATLKDAQ